MHLNHWGIDDDLVYMYSLKDDDENKDKRYNREPEPLIISFKDLTFAELPLYIKRLPIASYQRERLINSIEVKPKNPRFSLELINNQVVLRVEVENEYIKSKYFLHYDTERDMFYRPDFYHNYDRLESMGWFKSEFERARKETGLEFYSYYYGFDWKFNGEKLTVLNEFNVHVTFGDGDFFSQHPEYEVNFEKRKFEFYHLLEGHEIVAEYI